MRRLIALLLSTGFLVGCSSVETDDTSEAADQICEAVFADWPDVDVEMVELAQSVTTAAGSSSQAESSTPWQSLSLNAELADGLNWIFAQNLSESEDELRGLVSEFADNWKGAKDSGQAFMATPSSTSNGSELARLFGDFAVSLAAAGSARLALMTECQALGYNP